MCYKSCGNYFVSLSDSVRSVDSLIFYGGISQLKKAGFAIIDGDSAIVPIMLYDAKLSQTMAEQLLEEGIYVIEFFYPVVPQNKERIRVQLSAAHSKEHLDKAIAGFVKIGQKLGVCK